MEFLLILLPFFFLIFMALTYDKTVTPTINWVRKNVKKYKNILPEHQKIQLKTIKYFNLYDSSFLILIPAGLIFLTYKAFEPAKSFEQKLFEIPSIELIWILILCKTHRIEVINANEILFRGLFRKIKVSPKDIISIQDWLRGVRIVLKEKSIILWPFIEKQGEFKTLMRELNADIEIKDMSNVFMESPVRVGIAVLGVFIYFGLLIWVLFYNFTHNLL